MKNASKKIVTLIAMITLVLCMSARAVLAAGDTIGPNDSGVTTTTSTTLNIVKTLKVSNPALVSVAGPGLQYSFTVEPATVPVNTIITDGEHSASVHPGPVDGLSLRSAPYFTAAELLNASASGTDNTKNIVLNADLTKFPETGIYRYALTDTTPESTLTAAGVRRVDEYTEVRYVDVYVQRDSSTDSLIIEGYVVGSDNEENKNGVLVKETFDTSTTTDDATSADYHTFDTRDIFDTYNLVLRKSVTGAMGDKHNEFPFSITVSNSGRKYYSAKGTEPTGTSSLNMDASTTSLETALKDGDTYYIAGLRANDTVAYTERNNTSDTYKTSITGGTASSATSVAPGGTKNMPATAVPNATDVTFVNNHDSVSPTGVIMRFGPYIGMVVVAALLILMRKKAKANR